MTFIDRFKCRKLLEHKRFQGKKGILIFWPMPCRSPSEERDVLVINSSSQVIWTCVFRVLVLTCVWIFVTPWAVDCQVPLSMGFSRQEYWMSCYSLLQGIFPNQGSNMGLLHWSRILYCLSHQGSPNLIFFPFIFISWRLITLQYCSGFCHTLTWISHGFTCVPHSDPPSRLPLHPIPLGLPSAPAPSTCLMHPAWAGDLFHPW